MVDSRALFPLLRAGLVSLFVSLTLTHLVELFGVMRIFRLEAPHLERAIFITQHLGPVRLGMVAGIVAAASAIAAGAGVAVGRGGHARVSGSGPFVFSLASAALAAFLVGAGLSLTEALIPLADSAIRSDEFTVAAPGSTPSAFVTMANVVLGMGQSAVLDEMATMESHAILAHLVAVPLAEAGFGVGLWLVMGRVAPSRAFELLVAAAVIVLVVGAGFGLRATRDFLVDRRAVELAVITARLGAVFLLGAMLVAIDGLRRLEPASVPGDDVGEGTEAAAPPRGEA